jgi:hypothetical protein
MKVQFVLFHTPHADSFCHSCAITSRSESGRLRSSLRMADGGGRVGVRDRDRLSMRRWRLRGDLDCETADCETAGEYGDVGFMRGAVDVKYPGESSSDSSSEGGYCDYQSIFTCQMPLPRVQYIHPRIFRLQSSEAYSFGSIHLHSKPTVVPLPRVSARESSRPRMAGLAERSCNSTEHGRAASSHVQLPKVRLLGSTSHSPGRKVCRVPDYLDSIYYYYWA